MYIAQKFYVCDIYQDVVIAVARLQTILATHGIPTQTTKQVEPVEVRSPSELMKVKDKFVDDSIDSIERFYSLKMFKNLGSNERLGLTGRPSRPYGTLGTSRLYRFSSKIYAFFPAYADVSDFYLSHDVSLLIDVLRVRVMLLW